MKFSILLALMAILYLWLGAQLQSKPAMIIVITAIPPTIWNQIALTTIHRVASRLSARCVFRWGF